MLFHRPGETFKSGIALSLHAVFVCVCLGEQGGGLAASGSEEAEGGESY